jgi:hypothetical protein
MLPDADASWRRRVASALLRPYKFFAASDVFISYARRDAVGYAEAIAAHLADKKRKFSCHIDQWDTIPGAKLPTRILRAARWCRGAVIIGSPGALVSEAVHAEVRAFTGSPRAIVIIEVPGSPVSTAVWYPLVQGIASVHEPGAMAALLAGAPAQNVLNRLENAFTFWRRNRRIQSAAWLGVAVLAVAAAASTYFGDQAFRSRRTAQATELSFRAQDMLSDRPEKSMRAMRLGLESLAIAHTSWGESALRRSLMLMPAFMGAHRAEPASRYSVVSARRPYQAQMDGSGHVVTWSYDAQAKAPDLVFKVRVTDARSGKAARPEFDVTGLVHGVHFTDGALVVETMALMQGAGSGLVWAARNGTAVSPLPVRGRALAVGADGARALVVNDDVALWSLGAKHELVRRWPLPDVSALTFSADQKSVFAIRNGELIVFGAEGETATPRSLSAIETSDKDDGSRVVASARHVVVQVGFKIRIWDIAAAQWAHEINSQVGARIVLFPNDRLAEWSPTRAVTWDLSAREGVDFISGSLKLDCGTDRGRQISMLDFAISGDGLHAALACGNGTVRLVSTLDGTPVSVAPLEGQLPLAVGVDYAGGSLVVFSTRALPDRSQQAFVSEWISVARSSPQIGGGEVARISKSLTLSQNGLVAGMFHAPQGSKLVTFDAETGAIRHYPWAGGSWADDQGIALGQSGKRVALQSRAGIQIATLGDKELLPEGLCETRGQILGMAFGGGDALLAATSSVDGNVRVDVCRRSEGRWGVDSSRNVASLRLYLAPDPIDLSPVAISARGSLAYMPAASGSGDPKRTIKVETYEGRELILDGPAQVTALVFAGDETLVVGDRSGVLRAFATSGAALGSRTLGRHDARIVSIVATRDSRILSVGGDDIVRMWDLDASEDKVGVSGFMEFPLVSFGLSGASYIGAAGIALKDDRLVTLNQHARGVFAHVWKVPRREDLVGEAGSRLGPVEHIWGRD